jgi:hypothetical protein
MAAPAAGVNPRPSGCAREATDLDEKSGPAADTCSGTGVIWNRIAFESLVIPAKADFGGLRGWASTGRAFKGKVNCLASGYNGLRAAFQLETERRAGEAHPSQVRRGL